MLGRTVIRMLSLSGLSSIFGLLSALYIVWVFGVAEFAIFTISLAKLSILLLALELVPSQYSIFRMQNDPLYSSAIATFYIGFALLLPIATFACVSNHIIVSQSWVIVPYAGLAVTQRYIELKTQSAGMVWAFGWMPTTSNLARIVMLLILGSPAAGLQPADVIWGSLCISSALGQAYVLWRYPELRQDLITAGPIGAVRRLLSDTRQYFPYIGNSALKRIRDTFVPLFCDLVMPSKAEIGRLLVYMRANEAVASQVRVIEAFMVNRAMRENLRHARRRIFGMIAPAGQAAVAVIALLLMYRETIGTSEVLLALLMGTFIYPYFLELFWRNDALAAFQPRQVTISLLAFLAGMAIPPLAAWAIGAVSIPLMIFSYILGQTLAAATYRLFPQAPKHTGDRSQPA